MDRTKEQEDQFVKFAGEQADRSAHQAELIDDDTSRIARDNYLEMLCGGSEAEWDGWDAVDYESVQQEAWEALIAYLRARLDDTEGMTTHDLIDEAWSGEIDGAVLYEVISTVYARHGITEIVQ
jgi:hypothetical protein